MAKMNPVLKGFGIGWISYVVLLSLVQDVMGKARYLRTADANWTGGGTLRWVFVALEIVALLGCIAWLHNTCKEHS